MRAAACARIVFIALGGTVLVLALGELALKGPIIPGVRFASIPIVSAAVVVMVLSSLIAMRVMGEGRIRYGTAHGMVCPACRELLPAEDSMVDRRAEELRAEMASDVLLTSVMEEWIAVHGDPAPDRETVQRIRTALSLERAGDHEGAAQIYEEERLGALAGWVRKKGHI